MNILIFSWRGPRHPNAGGAEQVTFEHAKGWVEANYEVTLFTSSFKGAKKEEIIEKVRIKRAGDQFFGVRIYAFFWYLFGRHPKFDLVVDEFHGLPFFTPLYVRVKKLGFIHEIAKDVWKLNAWPRPINLIPSYLGPILEPLIFIFYKRIPFMTVSESTKSDLINLGIPKKNITVIKSGVKLTLPKRLPEKEAKKTALYLGAISKDKGVDDAIKVFAEIERKDDTWQYWIAGMGTKEYIQKLKKDARQAGIDKKLKYWGYVSERTKFELLTKAHILINPSVHEGWGLVNIEANSVGTPVVGYDVPGMRDSVKNKETGILVEKGDFRALAESVLGLTRDEKVYLRFQKNALSWSSKFSWRKAKKKSRKLIESL